MCNCIANTDALLARHNTRIHVPFIGRQIPFVETIKLDEKKRGKPIKLFASFCPFCGEPYEHAQKEGALSAFAPHNQTTEAN